MADMEAGGVRLHVVTVTDDKEHYLTHCNVCGFLGVAWGESAAVGFCEAHLYEHGVAAIEKRTRE